MMIWQKVRWFWGWLMTNIVLTLWALKGDWFYGSGGLDKGNIRYFLLWFDLMSVTMTLMMPTCTRSSSPTAPSRPRQRICKREILVRKIIWDLKKRKSHTCYFVIHFLRQMKKSEIKLTERTEMFLVLYNFLTKTGESFGLGLLQLSTTSSDQLHNL